MRLKIGLLGIEDPGNVRASSGTPYYLTHFLREAGHEVRICGPYPLRTPLIARSMNKLLRITSGKHLVLERYPSVSRQYAGIVDSYAAANPDLDLLLATSVFYVDKRVATIPLVAWGDTTVAGVLGKYPYYSDIPARMVEYSHRVEQRGLNACDHVIFSSRWAAEIALQNYTVRSNKIDVVTYGANIMNSPSRNQVAEIVSGRTGPPFRVILVGVEWQRKGVDKAIAVVGELRKKGMDVTLQVVGCTPPPGGEVPNFVQVLGRIPKDSPEGERRFCELLKSAHVFLLPTVAECASVSLAEANAYGLPVVASDVGGNGSLVKEGVNGHLCAIDAPASVWAQVVEKVIGDVATYRDQCLRAHGCYENELSWKVAIRRFEEIMLSMLRTFGGAP